MSLFPLRRFLFRPSAQANQLSPFAALRPEDFSPRLAARLLVLQPTPFCNINCDYCYLPDRDTKARMSLGTVKLAVSRLAEDGVVGPELTVVWHAGEPLVLPPAYYEDAFGAIGELLGGTCRVAHSIQTNATLIDDAWCQLFQRSDVRLGISLDGPAVLHNRHRKTRGGKGTHAAVMRGVQALKRHGIRFHVITVITADALDQAEAIHAFFTEHGIAEVGFNFDEVEGTNTRSSLTSREDMHKTFINKTLELFVGSTGQYQVRELAYAFRLIADGLPAYRWGGLDFPDNAQTIPFAIVTVAWNGDFSTFSPELLGQPSAEFANFILGNVQQSSFLESTRTDRFLRLWTAVRAGVSACQNTCAYFGYCGGGAPANKLYENGALTSTETLYCRTMLQRPFDAVLARLEADMSLQTPAP